MLRVLGDLQFLAIGPMIVFGLGILNLMTAPGHWWVQWPALGIGIAWMICLFRVVRAVVLLGGLAVVGTWIARRMTR